MSTRQSPERVPKEFHRHKFSHRDSSPPALNHPSIDHCDRGRPNNTEAREADFNVTEALLCSLGGRVSAPTNLANKAAQGESAYALVTLERLLDFIRQV
jgi:hypothetical protein